VLRALAVPRVLRVGLLPLQVPLPFSAPPRTSA